MLNKLKSKYYRGLAVATMAAMPVMAFADENNAALEAAKTELASLKTGIAGIGGVVIGIVVAIVAIGIMKQGVRKAG
ncbi:major capsid protein [Neisseria bacilliformis]|uniref:major capsid protein n=1 Tax=Neisseria bacilliformis TaxID=267212 RepID=UPI0006684176|nr:major capsid protein [Neisseria bacilliformis]